MAQLVADATAAEEAGFTSIWVPQIPGDFDAFTAMTLMGQATERIELGTAVMPIQTRHPIAMAQEVLSNQAVCEGRFTLGLGASHDWVIEGKLGLSYERPAHLMRNYLEVLNAALARSGLGGRRERRVPRAQPDGRHGLGPQPGAARGAGPGDAPPRRRARVGDDPVDGRRARRRGARRPAHHEGRGRGRRPAPRVVAGIPVALCPKDEVDDARAWANQVLGHAEFCPNYQRLLERGDATDVGDILAAGDESAVVDRLRAFRDAGVTDLAVRVLAIGPDREARIESRKRTAAFLASLCPEL